MFALHNEGSRLWEGKEEGRKGEINERRGGGREREGGNILIPSAWPLIVDRLSSGDDR